MRSFDAAMTLRALFSGPWLPGGLAALGPPRVQAAARALIVALAAAAPPHVGLDICDGIRARATQACGLLRTSTRPTVNQ
jgi:hypothetical protein